MTIPYTVARHLSADIALAHPYANPYKIRRGKNNRAHKDDRPKPGTILMMSPGKDDKGPHVACLFAQV